MNAWFVLNLEPLTVQTLLIILFSVTALGGILALSYRVTHIKQGYEQSLLFTLLVMPLVVSIVVLLVSNNLARAFSLAGVFTLVRFRLAMKDASDLAYILAAVGIGLALALGYVLLGIIITLFLSIALMGASWLLLINQIPFMKMTLITEPNIQLKETIESSLNASCQFVKLLNIHHQAQQLGLSYKVKLKPGTDIKSMIESIQSIRDIKDVKIQSGKKNS